MKLWEKMCPDPDQSKALRWATENENLAILRLCFPKVTDLATAIQAIQNPSRNFVHDLIEGVIPPANARIARAICYALKHEVSKITALDSLEECTALLAVVFGLSDVLQSSWGHIKLNILAQGGEALDPTDALGFAPPEHPDVLDEFFVEDPYKQKARMLRIRMSKSKMSSREPKDRHMLPDWKLGFGNKPKSRIILGLCPALSTPHWTYLTISIAYGHTEMALLILGKLEDNQDAKIDALICALLYEEYGLAIAILQGFPNSSKVPAVAAHQFGLIFLALMRAREDITVLVMDHGGDPHTLDSGGNSLLAYAIALWRTTCLKGSC